jgi:hypothetical protein
MTGLASSIVMIENKYRTYEFESSGWAMCKTTCALLAKLDDGSGAAERLSGHRRFGRGRKRQGHRQSQCRRRQDQEQTIRTQIVMDHDQSGRSC